MLTFLITGAGRGLGLALAEAAVTSGARVIGTLRDHARGAGLLALAERAPTMVRVEALDVADAAACARLGANLAAAGARVDVLINNAGINSASPDAGGAAQVSQLDALDGEALARMLRVNAIGALLATRAVTALMQDGGKVVNLSSRRGSLADKDSGGNYGYCMSKAALNMATRALAADLLPRGIVVVAVDPGAVRGTAMSQADATISTDAAARALLTLITRLGAAHAGRFIDAQGADRRW